MQNCTYGSLVGNMVGSSVDSVGLDVGSIVGSSVPSVLFMVWYGCDRDITSDDK